MTGLVGPYLPRLLLAGLLAALTELAGLALMGTATYLLVRAAEQPPLSALTVAIVAVRALAIGRGVLRYTERLAGHDAALRVVTEVRTRVYASLVRSPRTGVRSGDLLSRIVSDVDAVQDLLLRCLVPLGAAVAVGGAAVLFGLWVAPPAGAALAAGLLVAVTGLPALAMLLARRTADQVAPLRGALATDAVDLTHGAADLLAYGADGAALATAERRSALLAGLERRLAAAAWTVDGLGVLVAGLTAAATVTVALRAGAGGVATAVLGVVALVAVEAVLALVVAARRWVEIRGSLHRVAQLVSCHAPPAAVSTVEPDGPVDLALRGVTVSYAGRPPALSTVDLTIPAGRRIAVVGPSGAGKSTLLAVLAGLVKPDEGLVTADGRGAVTGLLAEAHVFHATVRENLTLGRPDVPGTALAGAAEAAGLLTFVAEQPAGWDTVVGEDGARLSGGQRQRLALARAVLAAPAVLLLDEPTEGLDPAMADRVLASVLAAAGPATVVLVTHRLAGLDGLDEIVVLDAGRIAQRGTHAELLGQPGWYRDHN